MRNQRKCKIFDRNNENIKKVQKKEEKTKGDKKILGKE